MPEFFEEEKKFNPVNIEVVAATVVAGNTVVIGFNLCLIKKESLGRILSIIFEPIPSKRMVTTFLGFLSSKILSM